MDSGAACRIDSVVTGGGAPLYTSEPDPGNTYGRTVANAASNMPPHPDRRKPTTRIISW
jgi:hypothetical protein